MEGIRGDEIHFDQFQGKKILVVNVASECGYTPQYQQLQELYDQFHKNLVVIGFPCNDFGRQEPGSNEAIEAFCSLQYRITFPMAAKISIREKPHPIYAWLCSKEQNGVMDTEVKWNFHKFLIDEKGQLIRSLPSSVSPFDEEILDFLANNN